MESLKPNSMPSAEQMHAGNGGDRIVVLHVTRIGYLGIATFLGNLLSYTDRSRFRHIVVCPDNGPLGIRAEEMGWTWLPLRMKRSIDPIADWSSFHQIVAYIRETQPDVVHLHSAKAGIVGRAAARRGRVPIVIYSPHAWYFDEPGSRVRRLLFQRIERMASRFCEVVVTATQADLDHVTRFGIVPTSKLVCIPNSVDLAIFNGRRDARSDVRHKLGIPDDAAVVIVLARMAPQKDPLTTVGVIRRVLQKAPRTWFIWAGNGPMETAVRDQLGADSSGSRVLLLGRRDDVRDLLSASDLLLSTSVYEALSQSILEAMAMGLPVVASDHRGLRELITHGREGHVCPQGRADVMADSVLRILADTTLYNSISVAAQMKAQQFSATAMATHYDLLYDCLHSRAQSIEATLAAFREAQGSMPDRSPDSEAQDEVHV